MQTERHSGPAGGQLLQDWEMGIIEVHDDGYAFLTDYEVVLEIPKEFCPSPICDDIPGPKQYYRIEPDGSIHPIHSTQVSERCLTLAKKIVYNKRDIIGPANITNVGYRFVHNNRYSDPERNGKLHIQWITPDTNAVLVETEGTMYAIDGRNLDLLNAPLLSGQNAPNWHTSTLDFPESRSAFGDGYLIHAHTKYAPDQHLFIDMYISSLSAVTRRIVLAEVTDLGASLMNMQRGGIGSPDLARMKDRVYVDKEPFDNLNDEHYRHFNNP